MLHVSSGVMLCYMGLQALCLAVLQVFLGIASCYVMYISSQCVMQCYMYFLTISHAVLHVSAGVCQCEDGWLGFSCAIAEQQPPTLVFIPSEMCDQRRDDCSTVTVYGTGYANKETLTCHFIQVSKAQIIETESMRHVFSLKPSLLNLFCNEFVCSGQLGPIEEFISVFHQEKSIVHCSQNIWCCVFSILNWGLCE